MTSNLLGDIKIDCEHNFLQTDEECLMRVYFVGNFKSQLYVATCSPAQDAGAGYVAWGHSTLVGPVSGY
jgi:hypothetical protein